MKSNFKQQNIIQWFKQPLYTDSRYTYLAFVDYARQMKESMVEFKINGYRYYGFEVPYNKRNLAIMTTLSQEIKALDGENISLVEGINAYQVYREKRKLKNRR